MRVNGLYDRIRDALRDTRVDMTIDRAVYNVFLTVVTLYIVDPF